MPISFVQGNIFDSNASVWVNPVNCVGVMGAGLAKKFKERFPSVYELYRDACKSSKVSIGIVHWAPTLVETPRLVANFPTKSHYNRPSQLHFIRDGIVSLAKGIRQHNVTSIAIPSLGCGLGDLQWVDVKKLLIEGLQGLENVAIDIYEPKA